MSTYSSDQELHVMTDDGERLDVASSPAEELIRVMVWRAVEPPVEHEFYLSPDVALAVAGSLLRQVERLHRMARQRNAT